MKKVELIKKYSITMIILVMILIISILLFKTAINKNSEEISSGIEEDIWNDDKVTINENSEDKYKVISSWIGEYTREDDNNHIEFFVYDGGFAVLFWPDFDNQQLIKISNATTSKIIEEQIVNEEKIKFKIEKNNNDRIDVKILSSDNESFLNNFSGEYEIKRTKNETVQKIERFICEL